MGASKRNKKLSKADQIPDWHLWSEVTRSISPLPRGKYNQSPILSSNISHSVKTTLTESEKSQNRHLSAQKNRKSKSLIKNAWSPNAVPHHGMQFQANAPHLPSIEPRMHRRMRRGQMPIDATIDLHGLHQNEARSALYRFVQTRIAHGDRTLLIITGKGLKKTGFGQIQQRGVLRHMLPMWLKEPGLAPMIAGVETSARQHGGEGAFYVRLRRTSL